jgi:hypothetical protein
LVALNFQAIAIYNDALREPGFNVQIMARPA